MSGEKILNGVDVEAVKGLINAVSEKPDLGKSKFRANNKWIDGGHSQTTITGFYGAGRRFHIPNHLYWMQTNPLSWRDRIKQRIL